MSEDLIGDTYEVVALCLAWISISEDVAIGTNQNKKELWGNILDKFNSNSNINRTYEGVYDW